MRAWIKIGEHWEGEIVSLEDRYLSQQRAQYRVIVKTLSGTVPAVGQSDTIEIVGEDIHRGEMGWWTFIKNLWTSLTALTTIAGDDRLILADKSDSSKVKPVEVEALALAMRALMQGDADQQGFSATTYHRLHF